MVALAPAGAIYYQMDEDDLRRVLAFDDAMIGSDGLPHDEFPHPRLWGTFPRVLGHYSRNEGLLELADAIGWALPTTDPDDLQAWFTAGADTKDLMQYLATFEHTLAVMQTAEHIERVAYEAVTDLAADGVRYAEIRFAPELHQTQRLPLDAVVQGTVLAWDAVGTRWTVPIRNL